MDMFQKGEYPVQQVIFINFDSVSGALLTGALKKKYGTVDVLHNLRTPAVKTDLQLLMLTTRNVVTTCWDEERTLKVLGHYEKARGWPKGSVRVYKLCQRMA